MADSAKAGNILYYGDNLDILQRYVKDETVDLVYLDPPFNSNATYNVLFAEKDGTQSSAQMTAFDDTWHWDTSSSKHYTEVVELGGKPSEAMQAFRQLLGTNDMLAYLANMAPRLMELRRVLKPTGSLYLHCDPTASHYLKILMDAIFGPRCFRTEIAWKRSSAHSDTKQGRKQHGRIHDILLFYTKGDDWTWNPVYTPYDPSYVESFYKYVEEKTGRRYTTGDLTGPGGAAKGNPSYEVMGVTRYWRFSKKEMQRLIDEGRIIQASPDAVPRYKRYLDEMPGVPLQDMWTDIGPISAQASERLGYPTQKPETLLERVITSSSNEGDLVLDPFCGCGTTVAVAQRLNRRWIGIDITHLAIGLMRKRLTHAFGSSFQCEVIGEPKDLTGAQKLAGENPYQFQWWALDKVGARPIEEKKGADKGIDGKLYFHEGRDTGKTEQIIISVKAGHTNVTHVRDLRGVIEREKAAIGLLITMEKLTRPMREEAASAGFWQSDSPQKYPKIQLLTIEDILGGKGIDYPPAHSVNVTFKRAPKAQADEPENLELFGGVKTKAKRKKP